MTAATVTRDIKEARRQVSAPISPNAKRRAHRAARRIAHVELRTLGEHYEPNDRPRLTAREVS